MDGGAWAAIGDTETLGAFDAERAVVEPDV
jgi:hypothetical protein